jgi:MOSC domain-containing protein YiiM
MRMDGDGLTGRVTGLQVSRGGVPKVDGDRQTNRRFHGGPTRAVCLYSQESASR